ncbi:hypothetical protein AMTRI_Chr13g116750 [Amborella trichopoda]
MDPTPHTCKHCSKTFATFTALGGHMRSHSTTSTITTTTNTNPNPLPLSYSLRNNPKKTRPFVLYDSQTFTPRRKSHPPTNSGRKSGQIPCNSGDTDTEISSSISDAASVEENVAVSLMLLSRGMYDNPNSPKNRFSGEFSGVVLPDSGVCESSEPSKKSKFECSACKKIFKSYQALGGHRARHMRIKGISATSMENGELLGCLNNQEIEEGKIESSATTMENGEFWGFSNKGESSKEIKKIEGSPATTMESGAILGTPNNQKAQGNRRKIDSLSATAMENGRISGFPNKTKIHQCPYCYRVFGSGQALGGHKRSHGASAKLGLKPPSEAESVLDLNKPAPVNEVEGDAISRIEVMGEEDEVGSSSFWRDQ